MRKPRLGSIYQRGEIWWVKYYRPGNPLPFRESSHSTDADDAEQLLRKRNGDIAAGNRKLGPDRVRMAELFAELVEDYLFRERATVDDVRSRIDNHLIPFFGHIRASDFKTQDIKRYVVHRRKQDEDVTNATINRELAIVRRAFRLGAQSDPPKVGHVPYIQLLPENNVRTGFLEHEQYITLRNELPWYLRSLFVSAYHVGGRRGELTSIQWPQVDFSSNQIHLYGRDTKNKEPRTLPIYGDMREWLVIAKQIRDEKFPTCPWVFYGEEGQRCYWFYDAWDSACERANVPGLLFHDLRRAAVRNMETAGVPRQVGMSISGHKTESIYRRYDIRSPRDLTDAAARLDQYFVSIRDGKPSAPGTISGTIEPDAPTEAPEAVTKLLN